MLTSATTVGGRHFSAGEEAAQQKAPPKAPGGLAPAGLLYPYSPSCAGPSSARCSTEHGGKERVGRWKVRWESSSQQFQDENVGVPGADCVNPGSFTQGCARTHRCLGWVVVVCVCVWERSWCLVLL